MDMLAVTNIFIVFWRAFFASPPQIILASNIEEHRSEIMVADGFSFAILLIVLIIERTTLQLRSALAFLAPVRATVLIEVSLHNR